MQQSQAPLSAWMEAQGEVGVSQGVHSLEPADEGVCTRSCVILVDMCFTSH